MLALALKQTLRLLYTGYVDHVLAKSLSGALRIGGFVNEEKVFWKRES